MDAHVHFHRHELIAATLDAAMANFNALGASGAAPGFGVLLLAQSARERVFEWLRDQPLVGDWFVRAVPAEPQSLRLQAERGELLVVCGRQVNAERGLEALALGTDRTIEDGQGLERTLAMAQSVDAVPVLPWGFGKWTGRRKQLVRGQIVAARAARLWVGDNGGRLRMLPRPGLLDEAEAHGLGVLPGSDPFPFARDYRRVGSFGCLLDVAFEPSRPWTSIRAGLERISGSPPAYGHGAGWLEFGFRQAWIQVHKRRDGRPA